MVIEEQQRVGLRKQGEYSILYPSIYGTVQVHVQGAAQIDWWINQAVSTGEEEKERRRRVSVGH